MKVINSEKHWEDSVTCFESKNNLDNSTWNDTEIRCVLY